MARGTAGLNLSGSQIRELEIAAKDTSDKSVALRAAMVLKRSEGMTVQKVAEELSQRPNTVSMWVNRYQQSGLAGLRNLSRGKSRDVYGNDLAQRLQNLLDSTPPDNAAAWTRKLLAQELEIPVRTVGRYLRKLGCRLTDLRLRTSELAQTCDSRSGEAGSGEHPAGAGTVSQEGAADSSCSGKAADRNGLEIVFRGWSHGQVLTEVSVMGDGVLADPDDFDIGTEAGFRRDFASYESCVIALARKVLEDFSTAYLRLVAESRMKANPELNFRMRRVLAEFGMLLLPCTGELARANTDEIILSQGQEEAEIEICTHPGGSYRSASRLLSLLQHRPGDQINPRTLEDLMVRTGRQIHSELNGKADAVLKEDGFDPETMLPAEDAEQDVRLPEDDSSTDRKVLFEQAIASFNEGKPEYAQIKDSAQLQKMELDPSETIYIRIDEVGVKRQNEKRKKDDKMGSKSSKNVENTVIQVQYRDLSYTITDTSMDKAFKLLLAFLLRNGMKEGKNLVIFSDGAQNILKAVEKYLAFYPNRLILDWYHLQKRMKELGSTAFRGSIDGKKAIINHINTCLWAGNVDDALKYLKNLDAKEIKNEKSYNDMLKYLDIKKRPYICCYALRKALNYPNASSQAEKSNDLVVAQRQKHNGMSWSYPGSGALAMITALQRNGELPGWLQTRKTRFAFQKAA